MLYMIFCEDKADSMPLRMQTRAEHLAYIQPLVDQQLLLSAGPTPHLDPQNTGDKGVSGSLIIAEFDSFEAAQHWADNDPYARAGLFEKVVIKPYLKVLP